MAYEPEKGLSPKRPSPLDPTESEPFYRTPEFRRFLGLAGLLAIVGVFGFSYFRAQQKIAETAEARALAAAMPKHELTTEEKEARSTLLLSKFEGALSDTENGQDINKQTPGYWKLLETLIQYSPEDVHAKATRDLDLEGAEKDPDAWRGEWVRARGIVGEMWAIRLARPVLGRTDVFRAVLSDGERHFFVDWTEKPPNVDFTGDAVDVEGLFYRTVSYEGATGKTHANSPLVIVRNMQVVSAAHEGGISGAIKDNMLAIVGALAFAIFLSALLLSWAQKRGKRTRSRAQPATIREMFEKKLREEGRVPPAPQ